MKESEGSLLFWTNNTIIGKRRHWLCVDPINTVGKYVITRPGDLVGAGPNWVNFWSKFGLF